MAELPHIPWYTSDFLAGVADLNAEQIGVYTIVLTLIADKASPIDDDPAWIGRRCNISTRRASMILGELATLNKLVRKNGLIGNERMLREVRKRGTKSAKASVAANIKWDRWRAEHKPQLPLPEPEQRGEKPENISQKNAQTMRDNPEINGGINHEERQNSAGPAMQTHSDSRARGEPEPESIQPDNQSENQGRLPAETDDRAPDFISLFELVCAAAGYCPTSTSAIAKAQDHVKAWQALGADFGEVVIPTIQRVMHESTEPTNSLARFDRQIRHEHAKRTAKPNGAAPPGPPPEPILAFEDEPELAQLIRADMLKHMGRAYVAQAHSISLRIAPWRSPDELILHVDTRGKWSAFWDGNNPQMMRHLAQKHGLADAWKGR